VVAVPSNLDRDDASELSMLAERPLLTLPPPRNPAFYDALIMALQIAGLSVALLEVDAPSVARLRTPGVPFRRLGGITLVGCNIGAVVRNAECDPSLSVLISGLAGPQRQRSMIAA
jgi:hypothetical protein